MHRDRATLVFDEDAGRAGEAPLQFADGSAQVGMFVRPAREQPAGQAMLAAVQAGHVEPVRREKSSIDGIDRPAYDGHGPAEAPRKSVRVRRSWARSGVGTVGDLDECPVEIEEQRPSARSAEGSSTRGLAERGSLIRAGSVRSRARSACLHDCRCLAMPDGPERLPLSSVAASLWSRLSGSCMPNSGRFPPLCGMHPCSSRPSRSTATMSSCATRRASSATAPATAPSGPSSTTGASACARSATIRSATSQPASISKKKLDKLLVEGDPEAAGVVQGAIEEFAQELATVIRRFLRLKAGGTPSASWSAAACARAASASSPSAAPRCC